MKTKLPAGILVIVIVGVVSATRPDVLAQGRIKLLTTFDYPGAEATLPMGINDPGEIVGYYNEDTGLGNIHAFIRYADGTFSAPIDPPVSMVNQTIGAAINNAGTIAGYYTTSDSADIHGFFLTNGVFTFYDYPGAYHTVIQGFNDAGDFAGYYLLPSNTGTGFANVGGVVQDINIPGANAVSPTDINNHGDIVGYYSDAIGGQYGFRLDHDGTLHYPIAPQHAIATQLWGTKETAISVGNVYAGGLLEGLFAAGRTFITYDFPGGYQTTLTGINRRNFICGFALGDNFGHGFIAQPQQ